MPIRPSRIGRQGRLLDVASFARQGPAGRVRLSPAQIEQIARTAARAPEVVVKASRGATSTAGAVAHLRYIDRNGELEIETDDDQRLKGKASRRTITETGISNQ